MVGARLWTDVLFGPWFSQQPLPRDQLFCGAVPAAAAAAAATSAASVASSVASIASVAAIAAVAASDASDATSVASVASVAAVAAVAADRAADLLGDHLLQLEVSKGSWLEPQLL